jgi:hypothetical protein
MRRCEVPRCRNEAEMVYLRRSVCFRCWDRYTAEGQAEDALRRRLGMKPEPAPEDRP